MLSIQTGKVSAFGGDAVISREFYDPLTGDYLMIEAHEDTDGNFQVAFWVPDGNDGDHGMGGNRAAVMAQMNAYEPAPGMVETEIPEDAWC